MTLDLMFSAQKGDAGRPVNHVRTTHGDFRMPIDHQVRDLGLAEAGRHQIRLAEHEMPGLMALRAEYAESQPLAVPASPARCT